MRRSGRVLATLGAAGLVMALPASAALAADASGCSGSVTSMTADGAELDSASAPGPGGTASDPLVIDPQGSVAWEGSTDGPITGGTYTVRVGGVPVISGTAENADGTTSASGTVELADTLAPVQWVLQTNALVPVDGEFTGEGGTCTGSGYIAGMGGSTFTSPIFIGGATLAGLGVLGAIAMAAGTKATVVGGTAGAGVGGAS